MEAGDLEFFILFFIFIGMPTFIFIGFVATIYYITELIDRWRKKHGK